MNTKNKNKIAVLAAVLAAVLGLGVFGTGCGNDPSSIPPDPIVGPGSGRVLKISGRVDVTNAKTALVKIVVGDNITVPDQDGKYEMSISKPVVAGRAFADSVIDTVRLVIGDDTLREIPITTWSAVLPTNYIVQRNIGVVVGNTTDVLEAVWWSNDSIANTIRLGNDGSNRSGFIYTVYDDSMYARDAHLYWLFVRVKTYGTDSVVKYSDVHNVTAKSGNQSFDASVFDTNTRIKTLGYTLVPDDSSVAVYAKTKTVVMVLDSVVKLDTIDITTDNGFTWGDKSGDVEDFDGTVDSGEFVTAYSTKIVSGLPASGDTVSHRFDAVSWMLACTATDTGSVRAINGMYSGFASIVEGSNSVEFSMEYPVLRISFSPSTEVTGVAAKIVIMEKIKFYRRY